MNILIQTISILVVLAAVFAVVYCMLQNSGVNVKIKAVDRLRVPSLASEPHIPTAKECAHIFVYALLFRLFVFIAGAVVYCLFLSGEYGFSLASIVNVWEKWDAVHYLRIADVGYSGYTEDGNFTNLVFFPLYPLFIKIVSVIIPNQQIAGLFVSALCFGGGVVYMYKLACMDFNKRAAQLSVIFMSIFPFSFFFGGIMTESLFLLTSTMTLYYVRKHNWIAAGICGFLTALTRSVGVFLIFPATVELVEEYKLIGRLKDLKYVFGIILKKWIWLLLLPTGFVVYMLINYAVSGNALDFLRLQNVIWTHESKLFFKTAASLWDIIKNYSPDLTSAAFGAGLVMTILVYVITVAGMRFQRGMYTAWSIIYLIVCLSISWPISLGRYISCIVPMYFTLGFYCDKNKKLEYAVLLSFTIFFGIYMSMYLKGGQIM